MYPFYGRLSPLQPSSILLYSVTSTALCPLYGSLSRQFLFVPSSALNLLTAFCLLHSPLSPLWPSFPSAALCLLDDSLSPLRPLVPSTALCALYGPLSPLRPSVPTPTLGPLYGPLLPPRPSVPSTAHCPLYALCPFYPFFALYPMSVLYPICPVCSSVPYCQSPMTGFRSSVFGLFLEGGGGGLTRKAGSNCA